MRRREAWGLPRHNTGPPPPEANRGCVRLASEALGAATDPARRAPPAETGGGPAPDCLIINVEYAHAHARHTPRATHTPRVGAATEIM